jgi:NitT/TauT family transport system permease protein
MSKWKRTALVATPIALALSIWTLASSALASPLLPSPPSVARALAWAARDGSLSHAITTTLGRLAIGYALAIVLGIACGVASARSAWVRASLGRTLTGLSGVPSVCWLPLAILWFGLSEAAIQSVVVLGALVPIAIATEAAVRNVPVEIEQAARTMGARGVVLLATVTLPAASVGVLAGAKLGFGFAVRALLAAELVFVSGGLGQLLEAGRDMGDTALVVGVVVVLLVLGRVMEALLFARIERALARRFGALA